MPRGVRRCAGSLPFASKAIAAREMHKAQRLRAVERAYQMAIDLDAAISYDPATTIRLTDHVADREMELE